jgi:hypothetical protein
VVRRADPLTRVTLALAFRKRASGEPFTSDSTRLKLVSGLARFALPRVDFRVGRRPGVVISSAWVAFFCACFVRCEASTVGLRLVDRGSLPVFACVRCSLTRNCSDRVAMIPS